jgi:hypothetical protein
MHVLDTDDDVTREQDVGVAATNTTGVGRVGHLDLANDDVVL